MNPLLDDAGTHFVTPRLKIASDGRPVQLWMPADASTHAPEWRYLLEDPMPSVVTGNSDGSAQG